MKLAIHQPEFMPWLGFFNKMTLADEYVVLDHVQFKKRYFENRNRILSPQGQELYAGVPVISKGRFEQAIREVEIDNSQTWKPKLLGRIRNCYARSPHFDRYYPELRRLIEDIQYTRLIDLNLALIDFFRTHFEITCPLIHSSSLEVAAYTGSDLILRICRLRGADVYLCGASGRDYLRLEDFRKSNIEIVWLDYQCPRYKQLSPRFVPNMSALDLLFNHGPAAREIMIHGAAGSNMENYNVDSGTE